MASNLNYPDGEPERPYDPAGAYMRRPLFAAIRWGAILAGVAVGISVQLVLTLLGIATGLSTVDVTKGEAMGIGPLLWAGFCMLVAAFVGGYVAARMSGLKRKTDGILHGAVAWAVTTILFATLATAIGGTLLSGVFTNMSRVAAGQSPAGQVIQQQLPSMPPANLRQFQNAIQSGQRDEAVQILVRSADIEATNAQSIVDQALIMAGRPESASPQARVAAEGAMRTAGAAAWVVFLAVALALAVGMGGGVLGAAGARRVSWSGPSARAA